MKRKTVVGLNEGDARFDPVTLEIYRALYTSVAEEMGLGLRRTAHSPNIKERRDYSCAVFDARGRVVAQGDHMPVHLGALPLAVAAALRQFPPAGGSEQTKVHANSATMAALRETRLGPGDVIALNDPYAGGTHLPDVTLVMGVYEDESAIRNPKPEKGRASRSRAQVTEGRRRSVKSAEPLFFVANRAHHADIGGATPGSMGVAADVYGEGLRIPPVRVVEGGRVVEDVMRLLLANVRVEAERRADFEAQIGSLKTGAARLLEIVSRAGRIEATEYANHLIAYSARVMRAAIDAIPDGLYEATDALDSDGAGGGELPLRVRVRIAGERASVDFTGSAPQVAGPVNAVEAITVSAVSYVFRCLIGAEEVPASAGLMEPIEVIAPRGTIVNAVHPAPVAGGNVETSQRIVDVLFKALSKALPQRIPAASQGTMNNLTIGGTDPRTGREFAYYETIAGGMGARPGLEGVGGVHTHMTNSLNTPVEALEYAYPLRVRAYRLRRGSGGAGRARGGDGIVREIETLVPARMSLLADRRARGPYGLDGGQDGEPGRDHLIRNARAHALDSKGSWELFAGDRVRIETPGGGGHGRAPATKKSTRRKA
jgi:N-methylhydantoinase B